MGSRKQKSWTSLPASPVALGLSRLGSFSNSDDTRSSDELIRGALALGVNVFDTADIYGQGDSEKQLGSALRGRRQEALICTKIGYVLSRNLRLAARLKPL